MNNNSNEQVITKGLKRIYLHNSYIRNKRVKLQCDGHTNLIGGNGRGKTSMLHLLPVFAGISPEKMVQKAADKSSFLDFYLPNLQSMIVYEYMGQQGLCCVVLYRHQNGTKLIYRFIRGSAEETFFAPHFNPLFENNTPVNEIIITLQLNHIKVSKQIETVLDYRAVLHNDKDRFAHDKSLRNLAAEYAMCDRQYTLRHLGELTRVPMSKRDLIDKFKRMLVDAYLQDETAVLGDKGLTHSENVNLIEDIRSLSEFIKESPQLEKGAQLRVDVIHTLQQLLKTQLQGNQLNELFIEDEAKREQDYVAYLQQYEHDYTALHNALAALMIQLTSQQSQRTTIKNQIQYIEHEQQYYQELNIDRMISEYQDLHLYQARQHQHETHLQRLKASAQALFDSHDEHLRQVEDQAAQDNRLWEQKKISIRVC